MKIEVVVAKTTIFKFEDSGTPEEDPEEEYNRIYFLLQSKLSGPGSDLDIQVATQRVRSMSRDGTPIYDAE